jgi:glycosyltransferase involved in cell wall biosynthesis
MGGVSSKLGRSKRLLIVVNNDFFFLSHRLRLAQDARDSGWAVSVLVRDNGSAHKISQFGFHVRKFREMRGGFSPLQPLATFFGIAFALITLRPDVVHLVTIRPIIIGGLICRILRQRFVCALSGLGYAFTDSSRASFHRSIALKSFRFIFSAPGCRVIVQNKDDFQMVVKELGIDAQKVELIRGAGVDPTHYRMERTAPPAPTVLLAARLLWDKGLQEFVDAAKIVRKEWPSARFVVAGDIDNENPASASQDTVRQWVAEGLIEWVGHVPDIRTVLASATVVTLPSYREGLPRILLEAGAAGLPIVTTDVPGCREIVTDGINGLLVPARDASSLAQAILTLLRSEELRERYGQAGRDIVEQEFAYEKVNTRVLKVYEDLLNGTHAAVAAGSSTRAY